MRTITAKKNDLLERLDAFEEYYKNKEPLIHSFIAEKDRFKRLRREAEELARNYPNPEKRPPLYGLMVGVKDIFHIDGFPTQAGSRLPERVLRGPEAKNVTMLKNSGVLIAGKTVTTEFAYFTPGPTRNPHNTEHTPGGSSSGSAAATAAGLVDLALGTQTIGSIIRPASFCGVVGFKPSYGRISAEGVIPLARSLDHVGVFAQSVDLVNRTAGVLCTDWKPRKDVTGKPYLAIPTGKYLESASPEMQAHFETIIEKLRKAGYSVKRLESMQDFAAVVDRHNTILAAQAAEVHAAWYEDYRHLYGEKLAALIKKGLPIPAHSVARALDEAKRFSLNIRTLMDIHGIDVWISPAAVGAAPKGLATTGDPVMNLPWTQAGLPTLGLPTGKNAEGLPLGVQFSADYKRDEDLLAWGRQIERVLMETA